MPFKWKVPLVFRIRGAVIVRIWYQIIMFSLYAAAIVAAAKFWGWTYHFPENILSVLGVATGMLLVFRTNTSYDRFWEGRKLWSELTSNIRSLMRMFWVMIEDKQDSKLIVEKICAVNLLISFAYATKHYLREEYSYDEDELLAFAGHLPHIITPTATESVEAQEDIEELIAERVARYKQRLSEESTEGLIPLKKSLEKRGRKNSASGEGPIHAGTNIPLEISLWLSSFVKNCKTRGLIDSPTSRVVDTAITRMVYCLTGFERIRRTPIPLAYRVHLTHVTWIVLMMLPFHWAATLEWYSIAAMAVASFTMLGILGIGVEIEDPFGYDYNDLNLDDFCLILHKEAIAVTAQALPDYESWTFSEDNHPIMANPQLSAAELITFSPEELNKLIFRGKAVRITGRMSHLSGRASQHIPHDNVSI